MLLVSTADYEQHGEPVKSSGARGFVNKTSLLKIDFGRFWARTQR